MVALLLVLAGAILFAGGGAVGYMVGIRALPRMIARMTPAEVDGLADRVAELKGLRDGPS